MLSRLELVHSIFKMTQCIIKTTSVDIFHPKFCLAHYLDILPGLNFIFLYASMSTLWSTIVFVSPTNLPLLDGSNFANFSMISIDLSLGNTCGRQEDNNVIALYFQPPS